MAFGKQQHDDFEEVEKEEEENQAFLPPPLARDDDDGNAMLITAAHNPHRGALWYLRLLFELAMAATIILLLFLHSHSSSGPKPLRRTPVPEFPRKIYTFATNPRYTHEEMFNNESATLRTLHNWIELSSASRGYISLPPPSSSSTSSPSSSAYDLPPPLTIALDRQTDGPGYMMSVFHQLHCLSYLAEHFQQGYGGVNLITEVAHHAAHCFDYLRQGITCAADTTLEGRTEAGPGEGSEHECKDYDAVLDWANKHAAYRWREGLLPGESIL